MRKFTSWMYNIPKTLLSTAEVQWGRVRKVWHADWRANWSRVKPVFGPIAFVVTSLPVVLGVVTFLVESEDRQVERTFRAWQALLVDRSAGSSQREAAEYLNRKFDGRLCGSLVKWVSRQLTGNQRRSCLFPRKERASLANADLRGANLSGADLRGADLISAELTVTESELTGPLTGCEVIIFSEVRIGNQITDVRTPVRGANLRGANLRGAKLMFADLECADLTGADLTGADLTGADLTGAQLTGADLTDADLTILRGNLTQEQLDAACGLAPRIQTERTELKWRSGSCPENSQ